MRPSPTWQWLRKKSCLRRAIGFTANWICTTSTGISRSGGSGSGAAGAPGIAASRSSASAAPMRCAGSCTKQRSSRATTSGGRPGGRSGARRWPATCIMISSGRMPAHGAAPVSIVRSTPPKAHMSALAPGLPKARWSCCSAAM